MSKSAIFVEGHTEFYFVAKLIEEVAGNGHFHLDMRLQHGGKLHQYQERGALTGDARFEIMLVNCGSGEKVKSFIQERQSELINKGYQTIIGLQDVYPLSIEDLERLKVGLSRGLDLARANIKICLAIMEIESWFIEESTHFERINPNLSIQKIKDELGFDLENDSVESIRHPKIFLGSIYKLVDESYDTREHTIHKVVESLDFDRLYTVAREKSKSLNLFLDEVEAIFNIH